MSAAHILTDIIMFVQTLNYVNNGVYSAWGTSGTLIINNAQVSLTMGPYEVFGFAKVDIVEDGNFKACVSNVTFPDFNVTFDYIADFGINNDIPIYGSGSYNGRLNDIATSFCWWLPPDANEILDFDIDVIFRHGPATLTGIYRNNELDPVLADLLTLAKRLLAMWNNYEPACASKCILNPVFRYMTNYLIYEIERSAQFTLEHCTCLKETIETFRLDKLIETKDLSGLSDIMDYLMENLTLHDLGRQLKDVIRSKMFDK